MGDAALPASGGADNSIVIEYSLVAIEEIRRQVARGVAQSVRGGLEVGGVLYGTRDGAKVRVESVRPIESEHGDGPSFKLSAADRLKFETQLEKDAADPRLAKSVAVGWFVSHSRAELALTDADIEMFSKYFPEAWQVTLVVNPERGAMKAGFFLREPDGTIQPNKVYQRFNFPDRLAGVIETAPRVTRTETRDARQMPQFPAPARIERPRMQPAPSIFESGSYHPSAVPPQKKWPWIAGGAAVFIVLLVLGIQFWPSFGPESLGLIVTERDGQLQIEWNNSVRSIMRATSGSLNILDGSLVERIALSRTQLGEGRYMYTRKNGDVEVRMEVENGGETVRESSRFLGHAPVPVSATRVDPGQTESPTTDPLGRDPEKIALQEENKRIRLENAVLKERVQQLERIQKSLESRSGITGKQ